MNFFFFCQTIKILKEEKFSNTNIKLIMIIYKKKKYSKNANKSYNYKLKRKTMKYMKEEI